MTQSQTQFRYGQTPAVVLVHGPFSDASGWSSVIGDLQAAGIDVIAPAVPLRGLAEDADYIASVAEQFDGPVLLVGHSYGGAVITVAGARAGNVVGLVYVAAFALEIGESVIDIAKLFPDTLLPLALRPAAFPSRDQQRAADLYIKLDAFAATFAADISGAEAAVAAVSQRPITAAALEEIAQAAGWKTLHTWYLIATADRVIHPQAQRFMAHRARAITSEVNASHSVMRSQPAAVEAVVRRAATALARLG